MISSNIFSITTRALKCCVNYLLYMLWFNFIVGSKFYFPLFQTHYHTLSYISITKNKGRWFWIKDKIEPQHIYRSIFRVNWTFRGNLRNQWIFVCLSVYLSACLYLPECLCLYHIFSYFFQWIYFFFLRGSCPRIIISYSYPYQWESNCKGIEKGYLIWRGNCHSGILNLSLITES